MSEKNKVADPSANGSVCDDLQVMIEKADVLMKNVCFLTFAERLSLR